jgi:hypothetical protein
MPLYPDLVNTSIFSQAGVALAQYEINDPNTNLGAGPTGVIAKGSGRGMGAYIAIKSASTQNPAPRVTNVTGSNGRFLHSYLFNPAEIGLINMAFGVFNQNAYGAWSGTKVDDVADANGTGHGTNAPPNAKQATLLITTDAQDADILNFGQARFTNYFYPLLSVYLAGENAAEVAPADFAYEGVPTQSIRDAWGPLFTQAVNGYTRAKYRKLVSRYPMTIHRYYVNGSSGSVTFTLDYTPTTDQTGPAIKAWQYVAATGLVVPVTISNVVVGNRQVTCTGSFNDGDVISTLYQSFDLLANN